MKLIVIATPSSNKKPCSTCVIPCMILFSTSILYNYRFATGFSPFPLTYATTSSSICMIIGTDESQLQHLRRKAQIALRAKPAKKTKEKTPGLGFDRQKSLTSNHSSQQQSQNMPRKSTNVTIDTLPLQRLDKWGLPPPSIEDIFPLMTEGTELIPVDPTIKYTTSHVEKYLQDFYPNNINWKYVSNMNDSQNENEPEKMQLRLMHLSPPVIQIDNFLTEKECLDVQQVVTNFEHNKNSNVNQNGNVVRVSSRTISPYALSKRTSTSWFVSYKSVPTVMAKLQHILCINNLSICEEPQIVQYKVGQEFTWHYDEIPKEQCNMNGGQRIATILIYLNTIPICNGGSTTFRDLVSPTSNDSEQREQLYVQPKQGSLLLFYPSNRYGQPDDRTLHRSIPISIVDDDGNMNNHDVSKWIIQIWLHERSYTACVPYNNRIEDAYPDIDIASQQLGYK